MTEVRINDGSQLKRVNEVIHDYWFDLDEVVFDKETSTLQIRFTRPRLEPSPKRSGLALLHKVDVPYVEAFLRIHHVLRWTAEDSERIGSYDFNELLFDEARKRIRVSTGVPLVLFADVEEFELSVLVTDTVVKTQKRFAFLFGA